MPTLPPNFKPIQHLHAHSSPPTCARYSPSGNLLATGGADGIVHLWDTTTRQAASSEVEQGYGHIKSLRGIHTKGINDLSFSHNGVYLATASDDGTATIWSLHTYTPLRRFTGHTSHVLCLAFNPKGNILATGGWDETVILWNVLKGTRIKTLQAHSDPVSAVAFDPDGGMVVTGSYDGLMRIWDATTGQCLKTIEDEGNAPISHASFTPNGLYIISSSLSSHIRIWNYHTSKVMKTFTGHRGVRFGGGVVLMDPRLSGCLELEPVEEAGGGREKKRRKVSGVAAAEGDGQPSIPVEGKEDASHTPERTVSTTEHSTSNDMQVDNNAGKPGPSLSADMASSMPGFEGAVKEKSTEKGDGNGRDGGGDGVAAVDTASATPTAQAEIPTSADSAEPTTSLLSNTTTLAAAETNTSTIMQVDDDEAGKLALSSSTDMASSLPVSEGGNIENSTENGKGDVGNVVSVGDIVIPVGTTQARTTPPAPSTANGAETLTPARTETLPEAQSEPTNEPAEQDDPTPNGISTAWLLSGTDTEDVFLWDVQSRQCLQRIHTQSYDLSEGDRVQPKGDVQAVAGGSGTVQTAGDGQGTQSVEKEKSGNGEVGREDKPTLALAAHPFRREIAVGGLGGRWGNVVSVWRSS